MPRRQRSRNNLPLARHQCFKRPRKSSRQQNDKKQGELVKQNKEVSLEEFQSILESLATPTTHPDTY